MTNSDYDDAAIGGLGSGPRYPVSDRLKGCGTCNGSGIAPDHSPQPDDEQPCPECIPAWIGTILETCIRNVALGRTASHSSVTAEMVTEWRRLNPGRAQ